MDTTALTTESRRFARDATRFASAWAAGAGVAFVAFFWMITQSTGDLLLRQRLNGNFYDAQARALLHGHLDVSAQVLNIEAYEHGGKTYMYFPPLPSVLRMPIVAFTDRFDGRLTVLSMLAAFVIALIATGVLVWRIRRLVRGDAPVSRSELAAAGLFALLVGIGSPLYFTASRAWVYHEAALWGFALAICAYDQLVAFLTTPTVGRLVRAGAFAGGAVLSRATIGAGPLLGLVLVIVLAVAARVITSLGRGARWFGVPDRLWKQPKWMLGLAAAVVVPAALYAAINVAKFGSTFTIPSGSQLQNLFDAHRRRVLAANDGSLFTLGAIPTQLLQMARPDAISFTSRFPWVGVPMRRPTVVGDLLFDRRDPTVSITAGMPLFVVASVIGLIGVIRRPALATLRLCSLAAIVVLPASLSFLYIAQRYHTDVFPVLLLLSAVAFSVSLDATSRWARAARRTVLVGLAVVVALSCWIGVATALQYQRLLASLVPAPLRSEYIRWQSDLAATLGTPALSVAQGEQLPRPLPRDGLFVFGSCDALYVSDGFEWHNVERADAGGAVQLDVWFPRAAPGTRVPIVAAGPGPDAYLIEVEYLPGDRGVLVVPTRGLRGTPFDLDRDHRTNLQVALDPLLGTMNVDRNGTEVLFGGYDAGMAGITGITIGADPDDPDRRFTGRITPRRVRADLCPTVLRRAR